MRYFGELDDLSAAEAELLVVVQDGVHVLDPDGVDRTIEHVPALVLARRRRADANQRRKDAVSPADTSRHLYYY